MDQDTPAIIDTEVDANGQWPSGLFQFAWFPEREDRLQELADTAEPENWGYNYTPTTYKHPVLYDYLRYTYLRLVEQDRIQLSPNGQFSCFNTGLVTPNQEPIYANFEVNRAADTSIPWYFKGWERQSSRFLSAYAVLPSMATYFDDASHLVFDTKIGLDPQIDHMLDDEHRNRFPEPFKTMPDYGLQTCIRGAIENAKVRVARNYKTAIPQFYQSRIQLLLPLCLSDPQKADVALVLDRQPNRYRASTCLTLDMAYSNARLLAKPDRDWLQP